MIEILYEDASLLLCCKEAGLLSQSAEGKQEPDLLSLLQAQVGQPLHLVHRLDRPTGGCMVFAKTADSAAKLSLAMQERTADKRYLAVVCGEPPQESGTMEDLLFYDRIRDKSFVVKTPRKGAKSASLHYRVRETVETETAVLSLLELQLHTGRTHQIRVQCASRRLPLWGDRKYGATLGSSLALWSWQLEVPHPVKKAPICVRSLPPQTAPWHLFHSLWEA